ncbi:MAG: hypothetical protein MJ053_03970 [Elusimicrobiaceae bacterium]|nr:hypothetical protein [Elusimicrobiaceae bacterium]
MRNSPGIFARQSAEFVLQAFFSLVKIAVVCFMLVAGALAAGQSAVAPLSVRLLTVYGIEYAARAWKPYRHFFPQPYVADFQTNKR